MRLQIEIAVLKFFSSLATDNISEPLVSLSSIRSSSIEFVECGKVSAPNFVKIFAKNNVKWSGTLSINSLTFTQELKITFLVLCFYAF